MISIALKEWAAVISAIGRGDQILLLRKGGIHERSFNIESNRFWLVPTYLHQKEKQFKPPFKHHFLDTDRIDTTPSEVPVEVWCQVAKVFQVTDLPTLLTLDDELVFSSDTIEERYRFRPKQSVHVVAVRAHRLHHPGVIRTTEDFAGCKSWVTLDDPVENSESDVVVSESEFEARLSAVERRMVAQDLHNY